MMEVYCKFSVAAAAAVLCPPKLQAAAGSAVDAAHYKIFLLHVWLPSINANAPLYERCFTSGHILLCLHCLLLHRPL